MPFVIHRHKQQNELRHSSGFTHITLKFTFRFRLRFSWFRFQFRFIVWVRVRVCVWLRFEEEVILFPYMLCIATYILGFVQLPRFELAAIKLRARVTRLSTAAGCLSGQSGTLFNGLIS